MVAVFTLIQVLYRPPLLQAKPSLRDTPNVSHWLPYIATYTYKRVKVHTQGWYHVYRHEFAPCKHSYTTVFRMRSCLPPRGAFWDHLIGQGDAMLNGMIKLAYINERKCIECTVVYEPLRVTYNYVSLL